MTPTDSPPAEPHDEKSSEEGKGQAESQSSQRVVRSTIVVGPVSYTHLTLPTKA